MGRTLYFGFSAVVWLGYGLYCFLSPEALAASAGVAFTSATGATELRAMYGGLQMALGVLALLGLRGDASARTALVGLGLATAGLGSARLVGATLDGGWSAYTLFALVFEFGATAWAVSLLRRTAQA